MKNIIRLLPLTLLPLSMATNLHATLLAYEGFDSSVHNTTAGFATDNLSGQGTGSGSNFTGNWGAATTDGQALGDYWLNTDTSSATAYYSASTGQASYTDGSSNSLSTTSGQATFTGDGTRVSLQRFTTTGVNVSDPFYFSALVTLDASASSSGILFGAASFGSGNPRPFQFGFTSNNELTAVGYTSNSTPGSAITGATSYGAGTYLLVAKLTQGDDLDLWVNPLLANEAGSGAADLSIAGGSFFVPGNGSWSIEGMTIDAAGSGSVTLDELRMGTTWDDVSAIPEPSTLMIPVLAFISLGMIRRRKRS